MCRTLLAALAMAGLVAPWVNPLAWGPSPAVVPWLFSAACAVGVWALWNLEAARTGAAGPWPPRIGAAWLGAALISSVIALCQYFDVARHFAAFMNTAMPGEAYANLRQRNQFASLTMIGVAVLIWCPTPDWRRGYGVPAVVLLAAANAASASRTGLVQMMALAALAVAWSGPERRSRLRLWLAGALAYVLAALALPPLLEVTTGAIAPNVWSRLAAADGCGSRFVLWSNVVHLIAQKPWLGWGWGELDYAHYMTLYEGVRFCDILDNAHNLPLHLAVELGVPAAVLAVGAFAWLVLRARPWHETDPARQMAWSVLAVILIHSMLEYPLWYGPFQIAFALCLSLLWPSIRAPRELPEIRGGFRTALVSRLFLAALLLVAIGYAGWDYHRVAQIYLPAEARAARYAHDPWPEIRKSRLFRRYAGFAELTMTPLNSANAQWTLDTALALLHYSPEPRVIEKVIESAVMLGRDEEARAHLSRFRAAFPEEYARWSALQVAPAALAKDVAANPGALRY